MSQTIAATSSSSSALLNTETKLKARNVTLASSHAHQLLTSYHTGKAAGGTVAQHQPRLKGNRDALKALALLVLTHLVETGQTQMEQQPDYVARFIEGFTDGWRVMRVCRPSTASGGEVGLPHTR